MIKRILVALSGTPCTPSAIAHGVELAKAHDAELTGVTVIDPNKLQDVGPIPLGGAAAAHELAAHRMHLAEEHIEEAIGMFEKACVDAGVTNRLLRENGDSAKKLIADWRYHDLTVIGLRGLFEYGVLHDHGHLALDVIGAGLRPLLAVSEAYRPINSAFVAYDGSTLAARAMKAYCMLGIWKPMPTTVACFEGQAGDPELLLNDAAAYLEAHAFATTRMRIEEKPRKTILQTMERCNADLLVMGAAKRTRIGRKLLGDTARFALENSTHPIFLHH
ncbi:MAG: universal stress protein [Phycisphaerales bacterium]|jgi:nucleotide-binding universal stress UspA family protein|nr:universal stress protein [Phycisphaerales bacterium]